VELAKDKTPKDSGFDFGEGQPKTTELTNFLLVRDMSRAHSSQLTGEVPSLVQYDSVHKLFIVGEANRMRSDIQVFDPNGNLIATPGQGPVLL
jgi:hypothetical protein